MNLKLNFSNPYSHLPSAFYESGTPEKPKSPKLIIWNQELSSELSINADTSHDSIITDLTSVFSGTKVHPSSQPLSTVYAGHQFGHFSSRLGDGRVHFLGELKGQNNTSFEVQLKGSGRSLFSRSGDGKSPLGPVLREYIVSEAMHHLGVPTSRALAAVSTKDVVFREEPLQGGVLTRVAQSFLRIGSFEFFAAKNDLENLEILTDYACSKLNVPLVEDQHKAYSLLSFVIDKQAYLVAKWMSLGFVHGVMNTDNTSVAGLTIDYGPCAFLDEMKSSQVYSFIDTEGRYAYGRQPKIMLWNLARFAEALILLFPPETRKKAAQKCEVLLEQFSHKYETYWKQNLFKKMGLSYDDKNLPLLKSWLRLLEKYKVDYHLGFRNLSKQLLSKEIVHGYYPKSDEFNFFLKKWKAEVLKQNTNPSLILDELNSINPLIVPRNHIVNELIKKAYIGDFKLFHELNQALKTPYLSSHKDRRYALPPKDFEKITYTFCGT